MPKPIALFFTFAAVVIAAVVFWPSIPQSPAEHYAAILDWSDSMPAEVDFFIDALREGIVKPLRDQRLDSGATVDVFVAGANSLTEPFHLDIPPLGGSLASDTEAKQKLESAEPTITAFVRASLSGPRAGSTALLEILPRLPSDRRLHLLVVSDAKQASAKTINLEKTKITSTSREGLVRKAAAAIGPLTGRLVDSQIQFRLPSLSPNAMDRSVNDAAALESFWKAYFRQAASQAEVISFDSRIAPWEGPSTGGKQ